MKLALRKIAYHKFTRELICAIFSGYMKLVFFTSRVKFINAEILLESAKNKKPLIIVFWHNRLMMIPFVARKIKKSLPDYNFMTLASKHGDGQFVGRVMEKFGLISILGSSQNNHKERSRGIDIGRLKQIFAGLKKGYSLGITPDGPRGPNQKINGEIINIAAISGAGILPISYSSSRLIQLNTWDQFKVPLPFSRLCFHFDEKAIYVEKKLNDEESEALKLKLEERMNFIQEKSDTYINN